MPVLDLYATMEIPQELSRFKVAGKLKFETDVAEDTRYAFWGACYMFESAIVESPAPPAVKVKLWDFDIFYDDLLVDVLFDLSQPNGLYHFPWAVDGKEGGMFRIYIRHEGAQSQEEGLAKLAASRADPESRTKLGRMCIMAAKLPSADKFSQSDAVLKLEIRNSPPLLNVAGSEFDLKGVAQAAAMDALADTIPQDTEAIASMLSDPKQHAKDVAKDFVMSVVTDVAVDAATYAANKQLGHMMNGTALAQCNFEYSAETMAIIGDTNTPKFGVCCQIEPIVVDQMSSNAHVLLKILDYDTAGAGMYRSERELITCSVPADGGIGDVTLDFVDRPDLKAGCVGINQDLEYEDAEVSVSLLPFSLSKGPTVFPDEDPFVEISVLNNTVVGVPTASSLDAAAFPVCDSAPSADCNTAMLTFAKDNIDVLTLFQKDLIEGVIGFTVDLIAGGDSERRDPDAENSHSGWQLPVLLLAGIAVAIAAHIRFRRSAATAQVPQL
jgi:hypothetical protein